MQEEHQGWIAPWGRLTSQGQFYKAPVSPVLPITSSLPPPIARSRYLLGQQGQPVPRLRGRRSGRLQEVVFGFGAGHGTVRVTAVWLPPGDYHHPSGSGRWARLRVGGWAEAWRTKAKRGLT